MNWKWLILISAIACSSNDPTPYQKAKKGRGFDDREEDGIRISNFRANSYTKVANARLYAEFHAIENCKNEAGRTANILDIYDRTEAKEITRTTGSAFGPTYYGGYGMYPYYSRYSTFGVGASFNTISTDTWNETLVYPNIDVLYTCEAEVWRPKVMFREVPADEMKHLVKDLKGGLQVQKVIADSPNHNVLDEGDIILRANGVRIDRVYQLIHLFSDKSRQVKVEFLREGQKKTATLKSDNVTSFVGEAEKKIIGDACKKKDVKENKLCKN
ncbi:PDZ domain-containing protein [Peredibacter starrii]|uniref:PDZ domain-containing protein n=1 Tax=Peredibacter starrii TaxID=28202 RepID=A0AAX4HVE1_9BACT|nr:PDZ domain-containing protein [Peredibacter starrii]WPU66924.1 PDZ domain-containing protein [Peredibacter starrii]